MTKNYFTLKIHRTAHVAHVCYKPSVLYATPKHRKLQFQTVSIPIETDKKNK